MRDRDLNQLTSVVKLIERQARREALNEVIQLLMEKQEQIDQLLYSDEAQNIGSTAMGKRAELIAEARTTLLKKYFTLQEIQYAVHYLSIKKSE